MLPIYTYWKKGNSGLLNSLDFHMLNFQHDEESGRRLGSLYKYLEVLIADTFWCDPESFLELLPGIFGLLEMAMMLP